MVHWTEVLCWQAQWPEFGTLNITEGENQLQHEVLRAAPPCTTHTVKHMLTPIPAPTTKALFIETQRSQGPRPI